MITIVCTKLFFQRAYYKGYKWREALWARNKSMSSFLSKNTESVGFESNDAGLTNSTLIALGYLKKEKYCKYGRKNMRVPKIGTILHTRQYLGCNSGYMNQNRAYDSNSENSFWVTRLGHHATPSASHSNPKINCSSLQIINLCLFFLL